MNHCCPVHRPVIESGCFGAVRLKVGLEVDGGMFDGIDAG